ncbi:hypothetical protein [Kosakonia sacchari]
MTESKKNKIENKNVAQEVNKEKTCFIIMPIADHPDYEIGHFERVYKYLIQPACVQAGYKPIRADDTKVSNMIMLDVLKKIVDCDMAICDLSSRNANVFYELGLRQAFDKKTILIRDGKHDVPFDLLGFRYVNYSPSLRVDTVNKEINDIAIMLDKTDNADITDANSIVSILKMRPAEIDPKTLNKEESLIFSVLSKLSELDRKVGAISNDKSDARRYFRTSFSSANMPNVLTNSSLSDEDNFVTGIKLLTTFDDVLAVDPEHIGSYTFKHKEKIIGNYMGSTDDGYLTFRKNGVLSKILDTEENRNNIGL